MKKLLSGFLLLVVISALHSKAFAGSLNCTFKNPGIRLEGVETLEMTDDALIVNANEVIQLEHTRIKCGDAKEHRFDGVGKRLQIILKTCTDGAALEGHLIDSANSVSAEVICE